MARKEFEQAMVSAPSQNATSDSIERVKRFADGAALIFANAEALYEEAQLLGQAGHFARATVLHQISMEECSKIDTLGAAATSLLLGHPIDEARLARAFRNHESKNHANAYFAIATEDEMVARARGDWKAASKAFKTFQRRFHAEVNGIKNAGLYVDFQNGRFTAPADEVNEPTAIAFQALNAHFLARCDDFLRLLRRMVAEPTLYAEWVANLQRRAEALRDVEGADPQSVMDTLLADLRANYATRLRKDPE